MMGRSSLSFSAQRALVGAMAIGLLALASCTSQAARSPYASQQQINRDPVRAQRLTASAAPLVEADPGRAEQLLREALAADLYHGPAHNNLGVIYLSRGALYDAAAEFEWARKLMPGHPDPRMNLALTLERAGRSDESILTYKAALETFPGHIPTIQALTRLRLHLGEHDADVRNGLREIAMRGETPAWRTWAQGELVRRGDPARGPQFERELPVEDD